MLCKRVHYGSMISFSSLFSSWGVMGSAPSRLDTLQFDVSKPKVLIGLMIGGLIPYLLPAIPAAFAKWWLFVSVLGVRPSILRLSLVGLAEACCLLVEIQVTLWLKIPMPLAFAAYLALAVFPNLLLLPSSDLHGGKSLVRRISYAFALGLIYPLCAVPINLALYALIARF